MSIYVEHIVKRYGDQLALNDVSFSIASGEVIGFLGPNGAGKSTMMKILSCFINATSGTARVCDFDVAKDSIKVRRNIGYLPEHTPLYDEMYVREYLRFVGGLHSMRSVNKRVEEMIDMVGLQKEHHKKIGALSKGYRQRVGLAQALIHDPQVLILDEPTSGLDPNQLADIRTLIKRIGEQKTVMLSTHIMQEVEAMCNRVIIVNSGKIVADNDVQTVQKEAGGPEVTVRVEFDASVSRTALTNIPGVKEARLVEGHTWLVTAAGTDDIRADIFQFAVKSNRSVLGMQKEEQSLEDAFKKLTRKA
jgi:ABC-2 type transport system ATP-binding protein